MIKIAFLALETKKMKNSNNYRGVRLPFLELPSMILTHYQSVCRYDALEEEEAQL